MSIHDELMALPVIDRLMVCVDVYRATKNMRITEHRANALEVLFTVMAVTVNELIDGHAVKVERRVSASKRGRRRSIERNPPVTNNGRDEIKRWLRDDEPVSQPSLTHNPFADALKKGGGQR